MDDLISRQQAIDALQKCRKHCIDPFDSYHIDIQDAENQLSKVPPAQPELPWISVTERLPDNADQPGAFCPRYQVVTPYGVTEGWYRPHDHEKGGRWFALF